MDNEKKLDFTDADVYKKYLDMLHSEEYQELHNIYSRKTIMDIMGVARQENPHSSFISWLLSTNESHGLNDYGMKKLCETLCFAYLKYAFTYLNNDSCESEISKDKYEFSKEDTEWEKSKKVLIDKLLFNCNLDKRDNEKWNIIYHFMNGDFNIKDIKISREKKVKQNNYRRADIWIDFIIEYTEKNEKKNTRLLFLIENKVTSSENDEQTVKYIKDITSRLESVGDSLHGVKYFVPIYLYVTNNEEMKNEVTSGKFPCASHLYLVINYQYLMDGVFLPCLSKAADEDTKNKLDEYINCLGKSINDSDNNSENNKNIIMAVSIKEKEKALQLWEKHREILSDIGRNISNDHFAISNDAENQFYRTIFNPIINHLFESDAADKQLAYEIKTQLNDKRTYHLKGKNGKELEFKSQGGKNKNISALAYCLLRQYLEDNKANNYSESLNDICEKLDKAISNKWLCGFLIKEEDVECMLGQWKKLAENSNEKVCGRYNGNENLKDDCPLTEKASGILGKNYFEKNNINRLPDSEIKSYLTAKTCPFYPDNENYVLRKKYYGIINKEYESMLPEEAVIKNKVGNCDVVERGKGCCCIYDFIHCFFIGGFENSDIFTKEQDLLKNIGYNNDLPAVEYIDGKKVYVAKWWFEQNVIDMVKTLWKDDCQYINFSGSPKKNLSFDIVQ